MPKLADLNTQLAAAMAPKPAPEPEIEPQPIPVSVEADMSALIGALEAISARLEFPEGHPPADLKPHVQALIKGLKPPQAKPLDLSPLVEVLQGLTFPEMPDIVIPEPVEAGPYTFDIQRDGDGFISRVVATPGTPKKAAPPSVDVE